MGRRNSKKMQSVVNAMETKVDDPADPKYPCCRMPDDSPENRRKGKRSATGTLYFKLDNVTPAQAFGTFGL